MRVNPVEGLLINFDLSADKATGEIGHEKYPASSPKQAFIRGQARRRHIDKFDLPQNNYRNFLTK